MRDPGPRITRVQFSFVARWTLEPLMFLAIFCAAARAAGVDSARLQELDSHIEKSARQERIPGVAIAVVEGTNVVLAKGYGDGVTPRTPFNIGSLSKSFTAIAIMQLVQQRKLNLDAPVQEYLPWFTGAAESELRKVTLRHLLNHRSGLAGGGKHRPHRSYEQELRNLRDASQSLFLRYPPGERFAYWNTGYDFLGAVVSSISGTNLPEYVSQHIFKPLRMDRSYVSISEAAREGLVGHRYFFGFLYRFDNEKHHPPIAAGGLISCADDMAKYAAALMSAESAILSREGTTRLFERPPGSKGSNYYALAWIVQHSPDPERIIVEHGGATDGFHSHLAFSPSQKRAVVILANASSPTRIGLATLVHVTPSAFLRNEPLEHGSKGHPMRYTILGALSVIACLPVLQTLGVVLTKRRLRLWRTNGVPLSSARAWLLHWWAPVVGHGLVAGLIFVVLPLVFDSSPIGIVRAAPDWGSLGVLVGSFAIIWGTIRSFLVAQALRRGACSPEQIPGTSAAAEVA